MNPTEAADALLLDLEAILDEKAQNPFNSTGPRGHATTIGNRPQVKHPVKGHTRSKTNNNDCHCKNWHCSCTDRKGHHHSWDVNKGYKKPYNKAYAKAYGSWKRTAAQSHALKRATPHFARAKVA